jgi:uncharacterized protein
MEKRAIFELRAEGSSLVGHAAVFNQTTDLGYCSESISPGAFSDSLQRNDIVGLLDHDPSKLLGRTKSGSLILKEDTKGLAFSLSLPDTSTGRDVLALAERGDLGGCSVGFFVQAERWEANHRTLDKVDLREISIVSSWPAYAGTTVKPRGASLALAKRWMLTL